MDFDSSAKFIASLARFLQSLCNGYVEFDKGVEVIGHIYLSVDSDTGRKIDYVLNEKVCKNDNSVTFISNSFHAQPAEKPKPVSKLSNSDNRNEDSVVMDESGQSVPSSSNVGTVGSSLDGSGASNKRPRSPLQRRMGVGRASGGPVSKSPRYQESSAHPANSGLSDIPSRNSSFMSGVEDYDNSFQGGDDDSQNYPSDYPSQDYSNSDIDQKPVIDPDISIVKEEYMASQQQSGASYSSGVHPSGQGRGRASNASQSYSMGQQNSQNYSSGDYSGSSIEPRDPSDDPSLLSSRFQAWGRPLYECQKCQKTFTFPQALSRHKWKCESLRNIICTICESVFYRTDHYRRHMLVKHNERL